MIFRAEAIFHLDSRYSDLVSCGNPTDLNVMGLIKYSRWRQTIMTLRKT